MDEQRASRSGRMMPTRAVSTTITSRVNGRPRVEVESQRGALLDVSALWDIFRAVAAVPTVAAAGALLAAAVAGQLLALRRRESLGKQGLL